MIAKIDRRSLVPMLLNGKGAAVDRYYSDLLGQWDDLGQIIAQYAFENIYNMNETGLFFKILPNYVF